MSHIVAESEPNQGLIIANWRWLISRYIIIITAGHLFLTADKNLSSSSSLLSISQASMQSLPTSTYYG